MGSTLNVRFYCVGAMRVAIVLYVGTAVSCLVLGFAKITYALYRSYYRSYT